ncbi:hypothetical protein ACFWJT_04995 [Streptomyces sp. NPDC127069]|uniref:hypothetical protein n=1 Tax=Streptomyces sp. NPDC127069 TaxID=3347128 RepID=UPI0036699488
MACDIQELTLLDLTSLNALIDLARRLNSNGIALCTYNWPPRPRGDGGPVAVEVSRRPLPGPGRQRFRPRTARARRPGDLRVQADNTAASWSGLREPYSPAPLSMLCPNSD